MLCAFILLLKLMFILSGFVRYTICVNRKFQNAKSFGVCFSQIFETKCVAEGRGNKQDN